MALTNEKLLELYRKMLMVRAVEETHDRLLKEGKIQLMSHLGTGQEAVAIGVTGPLREEDILFGEGAFQPEGKPRLMNFAPQVPPEMVDVSDELLGDGRRPGDDSSRLDILKNGSDHC